MRSVFAFLFLFSIFSQAQSDQLPIDRLSGLFTYQGHFQVTNIRRAETISLASADGQKRAQELRQQGYGCIHKDPQTLLCSKNWKPTSNPEGLEASVAKFMNGIQIQFEGATTPPQLVQDGSTSQEWEVRENVTVIEKKLSMYRVIRYHTGIIYIAFPVDEEQPLNPLLYHGNNQLGLTAIANVKDTATSTTAYSIEAALEK